MRLIDADKLRHEIHCAYSDDLEILEHIDAQPSVQPQRPQGHWIEIQAPDRDGNALYQCSICHSGETHTPVVEVPFCWHCGAEMRGEQQ